MSRIEDLNAELVAINATTDEIAADLADLQAQAAAGVSTADADAFATKLGELSARLKTVASAHTPTGGGPVEPFRK